MSQASNGVEAIRAAEESRPDVIVMDVMMPDKDGVEACRAILELLPETRVLMITASGEEDAVIEAVAAGATGFVQKYSDSDELVNAVREVAGGRMAIPDEVLRRVFSLIRDGKVPTGGRKVLTDRTMWDSDHSYYNVLGVAADATSEDIRRAYRSLAKAHHPDVSGDPESAGRFREIHEAYRALSTPENRTRYNRERVSEVERVRHEYEKRSRFEQWRQSQAKDDLISRIVARTRSRIRRFL